LPAARGATFYYGLLGLLFLLEATDLTALTFDLALLRRNLRLRLPLRVFVALQPAADRITTSTTDAGPDQSSGYRMTDGGADDCAATGAQYRTHASRLLRRRKSLSLAS
jgi:hypothetical protein